MRHWKIGTLSAGLLLILIGILWLGSQFWAIPLVDILMNGWPVLLIVLGLEMLLHHFFKKDAPIKFDFLSVFFLITAGVISIFLFTMEKSGVIPAMETAFDKSEYSIEVEETMTLPDQVTEIIIDVPNGDLNIQGVSSDEMNITGFLELSAASNEEANKSLDQSLTFRQVGNKVFFKLKKPNNPQFFGYERFEANLQLNIPNTEEVEVHLVNGAVDLENFLKDVKVSSINGDIEAQAITGSIEGKSTNGSVELTNIGKSVHATSTNGDIVLQDIGKSITTKNVNGGIYISSEYIGGDTEAHTTNGEVELNLSPDNHLHIQAQTNNGKVKGNVPWIRNHTDDLKREKEGTYLLGEGTYNVELQSRNDDIEVNLNK